MTPGIPLRAALYLRVSTARQAEHDVSIPDQKRQARLTASRAATNLSKRSSNQARPPPTTAAPNSSA